MDINALKSSVTDMSDAIHDKLTALVEKAKELGAKATDGEFVKSAAAEIDQLATAARDHLGALVNTAYVAADTAPPFKPGVNAQAPAPVMNVAEGTPVGLSGVPATLPGEPMSGVGAAVTADDVGHMDPETGAVQDAPAYNGETRVAPADPQTDTVPVDEVAEDGTVKSDRHVD